MSDKQFKDPIVISGTTRTGTEIIVDVLRQLDYFMGVDLDKYRNNRTAKLLFNRPIWLNKVEKKKDNEFGAVLSLFERSMLEGFKGDIKKIDRKIIHKASRDYVTRHLSILSHGINLPVLLKWTKSRKQYLKTSEGINASDYKGWGWKGYSSQFYLDKLVKRYPKLHYVHVIEHGLDFAFSSQNNQLKIWASSFNINYPLLGTLDPNTMLDYWYRSNKAALDKVNELLPEEQIHVIRYKDLYTNLRPTIVDLMKFLGRLTRKDIINNLVELPQKPNSVDRYKAHDLSIFKGKDIAKVEDLGFEIETV